jgi:phospholipid/cholesterol/gamma-HCH transport system substrate-binding protein
VRPWKRRVFVLVVIAAVMGGSAFLMVRTRGLAPGYFELHTFSDDASGLMDGTQVRLNGIQIGYLEAQRLTNSRDPMRKIELILKVKNSFLTKIPEDSVAGLASDNLLGDLYVGIHRGQSPQHVVPGAELGAMQAQDISKMMARMSQQIDRLTAIADRANKLLATTTAGGGTVGKLVTDPKLKGAGFSAELDQLIADAKHGHGTITKLFYEDPLTAEMWSPSKRLDEIVAAAGNAAGHMKELTDGIDVAGREFQALKAEVAAGKGSFAKVNALETSLDAMSVKWNGMLDRLNSGQGTAGQLLVNPQLNEALQGTMREFQVLAKGIRANPRKFVAVKIF